MTDQQEIQHYLPGYVPSRPQQDYSVHDLVLRDVAFNRHSMQDGEHKSPFDNGRVQVGADGIVVALVQGIDEAQFKRTLAKATRATIGVDLSRPVDAAEDQDDADEMLRGGLQTALESAVVVFEVSGVSRTCTHQLVRSRRAAFHQQSQRASFYGSRPEVRMPESVWRNTRARDAWLRAAEAAAYAYRMACDEDISYQDARYCLLEGTTNYIMCEYNLREFIAVYNYRACSMFSWEIVTVVRTMGRLLVGAYPWLEPHIKISCEKTGPGAIIPPGALTGSPEAEAILDVPRRQPHQCTFQGWEQVERQCPFPWATEDNRVFRSQRHEIKQEG